MPLRILIVEDEPLIAMDLNDILDDAGHEVVGIAATTAEAVQLAAASVPFDLAILDIDLAEGDDGIETASLLRRQHGIEALFVSGRIDEESRARALSWQPVGFIGKPYLPSQVLAALKRVEDS